MTVNNGDVKWWAGSLCSPSICQTSFSETGFTLRAKVVGELRRCCARAVRTPAPPTLVHPILVVSPLIVGQQACRPTGINTKNNIPHQRENTLACRVAAP